MKRYRVQYDQFFYADDEEHALEQVINDPTLFRVQVQDVHYCTVCKEPDYDHEFSACKGGDWESEGNKEINEVYEWLAANGYESLKEWLLDSDYLLTKDGVWVDLDDNPVDPITQAYHAMEASNGS